MPGLSDHEEIPLPLVRRTGGKRAFHAPSEDEGSRFEQESSQEEVERLGQADRMRPGPSGAIAGLFAGAAALGVIQLMAPAALHAQSHAAATQWGVTLDVSYGVAYGTAAATGALIGACFASVTRYLRRWLPLAIWALVFFVSLTLLVLALIRTYAHGAGEAMTPAFLAASAAYAFAASFALPLRKRTQP